MITVFNRQEILLTREQTEYDDAREKLRGAGIDYQARCRDMLRGRGDRSGRSVIGLKQDYLYEFVIYVRREDAERARYVIQR